MTANHIKIIPFEEGHSEKVSELIIRNLIEINSTDYTIEKIEKLVNEFTPEKIRSYRHERQTFVAVDNEMPIGTLSVVPSWDNIKGSYVFLTIFVLPEYHHQGIGKLLIQAGENHVKLLDGHAITIPSSITAHLFYQKLAYSYLNDTLEPDQYGCIPMIKTLKEKEA